MLVRQSPLRAAAFILVSGCAKDSTSVTTPPLRGLVIDAGQEATGGPLREADSAPPTQRAVHEGSVLKGVHSTFTIVSTDAGNEHVPAGSAIGGDTARENVPTGMKRVLGGRFRMGSDTVGEGDERPSHDVTLEDFFLDLYEVTREEYAQCVAVAKCAAPSTKFAPFNALQVEQMFLRPKMPVVGVDWENARAYCEWNYKRLPREAEFERAVRGDDGRKYPWGNSEPNEELTVFNRPLGVRGLEEVGARPKGVGPYGHHDLAGNVWEWTQDLYDPYAYRRETASRGIPGTCTEIRTAQDELRKKGLQGFTGSNPIPDQCERSIRGGAFNYDAFGLRSTNRVHHPASFRLMMLGFRCAKSVGATDAKSPP